MKKAKQAKKGTKFVQKHGDGTKTEIQVKEVKRAPTAKKASVIRAQVNSKASFKTLVVRGLTRDLAEDLKKDGFTYSWAFRCWHKRGGEAAMKLLMRKYVAKNLLCGLQAADIKDEGKNPVAFRKVSKIGKPKKDQPTRKPDASFKMKTTKAGEIIIDPAEFKAAIEAAVKAAVAAKKAS